MNVTLTIRAIELCGGGHLAPQESAPPGENHRYHNDKRKRRGSVGARLERREADVLAGQKMRAGNEVERHPSLPNR